MKNVKNLFLAAVAAVALFSACSESEVLVDGGVNAGARKGAIDFGMATPENSTRASYGAGATFQAGDQIAVFAYQDNDNLLFNDQVVTSNGGSAVWTYSPVKYWQAGSTYAFYAFFPYSVAHTFGDQDAPYFSVPTYTVDDNKDNQVDLMIAKKNNTTPFNTVDFVFNHILSNVNFYFAVSADFNMLGISSVSVNSFDVTGLYSTGQYDQTDFTAGNAAVGAWTNQSGTYDFPEVTTGTVDATTPRLTLADDLLLLPQTIADDARLSIKYTLNYNDNSQSTFTKAVRLASIVGTSARSGDEMLSVWNPNVRYNYVMAFNPSASNIVYENVDWDGTDGGGDKVPGGDVVVDGNGDYWVDTDRDGAGDYPIVWEDVDGDGWLEGGVDRDGDGHIDDVDQDGDTVTTGTATGDKETEPSDGTQTAGNEGKDVILVDTDDDGIPDTQLVKPGSSNVDVVINNNYLVDYDGTLQGDQTPRNKLGKIAADDANNPYNDANSVYYQADNLDEFVYVDVDEDGAYDPTVDYAVVWIDIDDDDKLEGIADKNHNGVADDNFDGDNVGYYVDEDGVNNPNGYDVILIDTDNDTVAETQLERDPKSSNPEDNTKDPVIQFTATVEDWSDEYDAEVVVND